MYSPSGERCEENAINSTEPAQPGTSESPSDNSNEQEVASASRAQSSISSTVALWAIGLAICIMVATILFMLSRGQRLTPDPLAYELQSRANAAGAVGLASGGYFVIVCLYALTGVAAFSDAALRLIPNRFNYVALVLAMLLNLLIAPFCELMEWTEALRWIGASHGEWGGVALESLKGFGLCFVVGIVSFAARGLGGGDVKLLMALGALAGFSLTVSILLNALAIAALIGLLNLLFQGRLIQYLQKFFLTLYIALITGQKDPEVFGRTESPFCLSLLIAMILLPFVNIHTVISAGLNESLGV